VKLLVAGGGTGGHLFPGLALAEEVRRRGGQVLFVGTDRGIEKRVVPAQGFDLELLHVSGLVRVGLLRKLRGLLRLPLAFLHSARIIWRFKPDVVIGVGGYASGPCVLTAALMGKATAVQEQNSVPGFTNRVLSRFARVVFTAFEEAHAHLRAARCVRLGNPVRRSFFEPAAEAAEACKACEADNDRQDDAKDVDSADAEPAPVDPATMARDTLTPAAASTDALAEEIRNTRLLVVGGSQGARAVNKLVRKAMQVLCQRGFAPRLVHQSGQADAADLQKAYEVMDAGGPVEVCAFIGDMARAYRAADLVVARAGALTLAELAIVGKPAILIPLPTAAGDHQTLNAKSLEQSGAAVCLAQSGTDGVTLADHIARLLGDRSARTAMCEAMKARAFPDATAQIVDHLESLTAKPAGRER